MSINSNSTPQLPSSETSKKFRVYDNSLRLQKSNQSRQKIIQVYVDLLVEANGQDVPMQLLAKHSGTSMRTLFRFFGEKETLLKEIDIYLTQYMSNITDHLEKMTFSEYAEFSYKTFDTYAKLFKAYLYTNFGQQSRKVFRKKINEMLVKKILAEVEAKSSKANMQNIDIRKVRFIATLINAQLWKDLSDSYEVSGADMASTVKWAVQSLINEVNK